MKVVGKKFTDQTDQTEKYYGTKYSTHKIDSDLIQVIIIQPPLLYK